MLNALTLPTNTTTSRCITNAIAAHNLRDIPQLECSATLALSVADGIHDHTGSATATLLLGIARRDTRLVDKATRLFECEFDYYNAGIALCARAALETVRERCVVILHKALGFIRRAMRKFVNYGRIEQWHAARDIERVIEDGIENGVDGRKWIVAQK